jgi:hypothetical protein
LNVKSRGACSYSVTAYRSHNTRERPANHQPHYVCRLRSCQTEGKFGANQSLACTHSSKTRSNKITLTTPSCNRRPWHAHSTALTSSGMRHLVSVSYHEDGGSRIIRNTRRYRPEHRPGNLKFSRQWRTRALSSGM